MRSEQEIKDERAKLHRLARNLEPVGVNNSMLYRDAAAGDDVLGWALGIGPPLSGQIQNVIDYMKGGRHGQPK